MNSVLLDALLLLAVCTVIHVGGLILISKLPLGWHPASLATHFGRMRNLIVIAWCLIVLHVIEISIWAGSFIWQKSLPDVETAFYFSGVSYTTIGYGDVVLPKPWRLLGPLEGLTGILMCGLSTAFFFTAVLRIFKSTAKDTTDPSAKTDIS
jgi:hypothetical protein